MAKAFLIKSETIGAGDDRLGAILMANFLRVLGDSPEKPATIVFWNAGVKLVSEGSKFLEHLKKLQDQGVELLACSTCLEYYDLAEKLAVGKPSSMAKAIELMFSTDMITL